MPRRTGDLLLFTPAGQLTETQCQAVATRGIGVVETTVNLALIIDDRPTGVRLADGEAIERDALFVPPRCVQNDGVLTVVGCDLTPDGWVAVGPDGGTSVPGIWAAGNVVNPRAQVITAAGDGSTAAISINASLVDRDIRRAMADS